MARPVTSEAERLQAIRLAQEAFPGHLLRRAQQVLTIAWSERVSSAVTSSQFVILNVLRSTPGVDQRTLGELVCMDRSTVATLVARLTALGLVRQSRHPLDKRRKVLATTTKGSRLAAELEPRAMGMSKHLLALVGPAERQDQVMNDLRILVHSWEDAYRGAAPAPASAAAAEAEAPGGPGGPETDAVEDAAVATETG
jgi:MarR family transcriptional regulator, temperature-dependent positive regulator of motility